MKRHVFILLAALALFLAFGALALGFSDIPSGHPYAGAIADLSQRGIISGYADGSFGPDNPVTRQQFAKMIVRTLALPVSETDICPFPDVPKNVDPKDPLYPDKYVAVCAAHGITVGKDTIPPTFDPYSSITRQQLITMVARAAGVVDPPDTYAPLFEVSQFYPRDHFDNARRAAYAGLLDGLEGLGTGFDFFADASRGECAQLLSNLLRGPVEPPPPESTSTTTTTIPQDPGAFGLQVVSLTSPVAPGANAALTIKTAPGAYCTITVIYKSGPSQAAGLGPQTADPNGTVTWQWKVGSSTARGVWSIVVTSERQGEKETLEIPFEVR